MPAAAPAAPCGEGADLVAHCTLALGPDSAGAVLHGLIDRARTRLDAAVYEAGPGYATHLAAASRRGVPTRVLLDAHAGANTTAAEILAANRVDCRVLGGHPGVEAHWKLLLTGEAVAVGTGNLLHRDAPDPGQPGTREWWVVARDAPRLHAEALRAVDAAWREARRPPEAWRRPAALLPPAIPPVGVPSPRVEPVDLDITEARLHLATGGTTVAALLHERLAGVGERAFATVPYTHTHVAAVRALLDLLDAARGRGADVRLLLGTPPAAEDAAALLATPLQTRVRVMDPEHCTTGHAKGLVADGAAVVGSANWSGTGLGGNRESALLLDDGRAADWFAAAFEHDWAVARPLGSPPKA